MSLLAFAAIAYLALAIALVLAIDKLVALLFRETRPQNSLRPSAVDKMLAVSRQYYRRW
ncbi:hypothetical protein [Rhizobium sp. Root1203]|uniref:hypothetical protein n=1 Tax=Rhizobium sp. Root1203 TaxID=1736427 RepID=UPI000AEA1601|nr:hypothetical protein [Rhizobium sp. Root1203]